VPRGSVMWPRRAGPEVARSWNCKNFREMWLAEPLK
jgi:hypothetical protein